MQIGAAATERWGRRRRRAARGPSGRPKKDPGQPKLAVRSSESAGGRQGRPGRRVPFRVPIPPLALFSSSSLNMTQLSSMKALTGAEYSGLSRKRTTAWGGGRGGKACTFI